MTWETGKTGIGQVKTFYGPRTAREGLAGNIETVGSVQELTFELSGIALNDNRDAIHAILPKGSLVIEAIASVKEVFALGGTTPVVNIGTVGSAGTNGVTLSKAQLEAVGVYKVSAAGTWASGIAADTSVGVALGGTTPTVGRGGVARVTIRYVKL